MSGSGRKDHNGPLLLLRWVREGLIVVVGAMLIAFLLKVLVAQAFFIPSASMTPQLRVADRVLVSKISYHLHEPRRGDIVVFDCPPVECGDSPDDSGGVAGVLRSFGEGVGVVQPSTQEFIKRVVGLPGEKVESRDGQVFINGKRLIEPYLPLGTVTANLTPTTVPPGQLYVMGDNRGSSSDSRVFGTVTRESVVGRAVVKLWPPASASYL
ncbi:MAG TPA: signal peptidase I [Acidimicrobiales bacterium]|nr:signal peptidase I [Acidimicrobiales bacterium]